VVVNGRKYSSDIIILPDRIEDHWWRKEGHSLDSQDLDLVIEAKPEILIIGTGAEGVMIVPQQTKQFLKAKKIKLKIRKTEEACRLYNQLAGKKKVAAALHIRCKN